VVVRKTPCMAAPSSAPLTCRKRGRTQQTSSHEQLQADVRSLLLQGSTTTIELDENEARPSAAVQGAYGIIPRSGSVITKATQASGSLRRSSSGIVPICDGTGSKRRCWSAENGERHLGEIHMSSTGQ